MFDLSIVYFYEDFSTDHSMEREQFKDSNAKWKKTCVGEATRLFFVLA